MAVPARLFERDSIIKGMERKRSEESEPPHFSWAFFNFGLRRSARPLPRCYSFLLASRGKRDIKTTRDLLLRRRLTLKIPQLKLGVLREFRTVSEEVGMVLGCASCLGYIITNPPTHTSWVCAKNLTGRAILFDELDCTADYYVVWWRKP